MVTGTKQTSEKMKVKRYKIQHSIDEYTFPKEAYIHAVTFDEKYMPRRINKRKSCLYSADVDSNSLQRL